MVDYDDALFHQYDQHADPMVRRLLGRKIGTVMRLAQVVVAGNDYLGDYARAAGARRVEVIPTVVDLGRYPATVPTFDAAIFSIGWIGTPTTARYLRDVAPALAELCRAGGARVRLIGSGPIDLGELSAEVVPWREDTEADDMRRFDVGIMPLADEPWAQGKCGFKLIQYMACGLPVVASPVGVNSEIVEHGVNGFLARTEEDWVAALTALKRDPSLRRRMGLAGRAKVEREYSLQITAPRMVELLRSLLGHGAAAGGLGHIASGRAAPKNAPPADATRRREREPGGKGDASGAIDETRT